MNLTQKIADMRAQQWLNLGKRQADLDFEWELVERKILKLVRDLGAAGKGPKTRELAGMRFLLQVISGHDAHVDYAGALRFLANCPRRLGRKILRRDLRFAYVADAKLVATLRPDLAALLRKAVRLRKRAPRVRVTKIKTIAGRKAA